MLWWLLILGVSTAVVLAVAISLFMRVRRLMKGEAGHAAEPDSPYDHPSSPEA